MLCELMDDPGFVEAKITRLERTIALLVDFDKVARLCTIPGIDLVTAWTRPAEPGSDMSMFFSPKHAARCAATMANRQMLVFTLGFDATARRRDNSPGARW